MADKVVSLEFNVNTGDAVVEINKVTKATDAATKSTDNYEQQLKELKKATDGAGFRELNSALKQYRDIALQAGETTPIGRQALAEAGELKDRLGDLRTAIQTTGQDGRQLQAALQLGGGIVAGFGAVQGVMALVGSESEDLQKTLVKLQAAQAALVSIEEIRSVLEKESALRIVATTIAEKARAAATALGTMATNAGIMSLRAFKIALASTGVGAIVVLLGLAAEAMGLFGDSTDDAAASADKLNEELEKQKNITNELNKAVDKGTEKQILKAKIAGATEEQITKIEEEGFKRRISNLEKLQQKAFDTYGAALRNEELTAEERLKVEEKFNDANNALSEERSKFEIFNLQNELEAADKKREKAKEAEKKRREEEAANLKKFREERQALDKKLTEEAIDDKLRLEKQIKEEEELKLQQEKERFLERAKLLEEQGAAEVASRERRKKEEEEFQMAKVNLALQGFQLINQLVNDFDSNSREAQERAFKLNKAFQIAQATIEGTRGTLKAYAEAPVGLKIASAALAAAFAAAQIAKISQTKFNSAQFEKPNIPTGSVIGNGIVTSAPATPQTQSTLLNQPQQTQVIKAVVVESDITKVQNRVQSIIETASI